MAHYKINGGDVIVLICSLFTLSLLVYKEQTKCNTKIEPNCNVTVHSPLRIRKTWPTFFSFRMLIVSLYQGSIVQNIFRMLLKKKANNNKQ